MPPYGLNGVKMLTCLYLAVKLNERKAARGTNVGASMSNTCNKLNTPTLAAKKADKVA